MSAFQFPSQNLLLLPLSGVSAIGLNFYAYGYRGKWLLIDFGMGFANSAEGLQGVELVFPSPEFFAKQKHNIVGLVLTHAHEDHIGALTHLWPEISCPVYGSAFTLGVVREKLAESGFARQVPLHILKAGQVLSLHPFTITPYGITHSILEQQALLIEVGEGEGTIRALHTGDWKLDPEPLLGEVTNGDNFAQLADLSIDVLVGDSTNIFVKDEAVSEGQVQQGIIEIFMKIQRGEYQLPDSAHYYEPHHPRQRHDKLIEKPMPDEAGLIFMTCFASNLQRVFAIAAAAEKIGRKVAVLGRAFHRYLKVARDVGYWSSFPSSLQNMVAEKDIAKIPRHQLVLLVTGSQGEWRGAMARISRFEHIVKPMKGDYVIFSSRTIPGNDHPINMVKNNLVKAGVRLLDITSPIDGLINHASGHPTRPDLERLYQWVKPKSIIPNHGEPRHLAEHIYFAKNTCGIEFALLPSEGLMIEIAKTPKGVNPLKPLGHVKTDILVKDGHDIVSLDDEALLLRRKMASQGALVVSLLWQDNRIINHDWSLLGISLSDEQEQFLERAIRDSLSPRPHKHRGKQGGRHHKKQTQESPEDMARQYLKKFFRKNFDKYPHILFHHL